MSKKFLLYLSSYIIILLFVFRNLVFNLSTNLLDWRDYAFYIWMMFQNVTHIITLDFANFFETNAFYPHKLTLLFLEAMLPQSLIFLPFLEITKNLVLSLNLTFIVSFILNFTSLFIFWKKIFKKESVAFFGSLFFIFSPFFYTEVGHFPLMSYWPFFFGLFFLFENQENKTKRNLVAVGLLLTIQFLASVYLAVFMLASILFFYFTSYIFKPSFTITKQISIKLLIILFIFLITSGIFIKGYTDMQHIYNTRREIAYSANLSDFFFTTIINSTIHQSPIMKLWNKSDKNQGSHSSFPGFLVFALAIPALFQISKSKQLTLIKLVLNKERTYFLILIIIGMLFSLGPKLNFNGHYTSINLPYNLLLKTIPFLEVIRAPVRWAFLFYFGFIYFSLITMDKLANQPRYKFIFFSIFVFFIFEYLPFNITTNKEDYLTYDHQILKDMCSEKKGVLLELPVTHLNAYPNIYEGLKYITTTVQLASIYHRCFLVNGYSGYDLPENFALADKLNEYIANQQTTKFVEELKDRNINFVKINQQYFAKELKQSIKIFAESMATHSGVLRLSKDLYKIL